MNRGQINRDKKLNFLGGDITIDRTRLQWMEKYATPDDVLFHELVHAYYASIGTKMTKHQEEEIVKKILEKYRAEKRKIESDKKKRTEKKPNSRRRPAGQIIDPLDPGD